jgi:hypothetical protein
MPGRNSAQVFKAARVLFADLPALQATDGIGLMYATVQYSVAKHHRVKSTWIICVLTGDEVTLTV